MPEDAPVPLLLPRGACTHRGMRAHTHRGTRAPNPPFRYCLRAAAPSTDQKMAFFDKNSTSQKRRHRFAFQTAYIYIYIFKKDIIHNI